MIDFDQKFSTFWKEKGIYRWSLPNEKSPKKISSKESIFQHLKKDLQPDEKELAKRFPLFLKLLF